MTLTQAARQGKTPGCMTTPGNYKKQRAIPECWLDGILGRSRSVHWSERLGDAVLRSGDDDAENVSSPRDPVTGILPRNLIFLLKCIGARLSSPAATVSETGIFSGVRLAKGLLSTVAPPSARLPRASICAAARPPSSRRNARTARRARRARSRVRQDKRRSCRRTASP